RRVGPSASRRGDGFLAAARKGGGGTPAARVLELARRGIERRAARGDELSRMVEVIVEHLVQLGQDARGSRLRQSLGQKRDSRLGHEQGRPYAVSRHVAHEAVDASSFARKVAEVVAAHGRCGYAAPGHLYARHGKRALRQQRLLDLLRDLQVSARNGKLDFRGPLRRLCGAKLTVTRRKRLGHVVERPCQK